MSEDEAKYTKYTVCACHYAIRHDKSFKNEVLDAVPELRPFAEAFEKDSGRAESGQPTPEYHKAISVMNKHISTLLPIVLNHKKEAEDLCWQFVEEARVVAKLHSKQQVDYPSLVSMAATFSKSMGKWASGGFQLATTEVYNARFEECKRCEFWDSKALNGGGRCKKCGCSTWAKLRLKTEKCPIGKW